MDKSLLRAFWDCGDSMTIEFAMMRARLNKKEEQVVRLLMDECLTQEQASEKMDISTRKLQDLWSSGLNKLLSIPWVKIYAEDLKNKK